jgi:ribosome biogenesis GTPase
VAGAQGEALGRRRRAGTRERATIGDWVVVDARGAVSARLPRHGVLARAGQDLAANVDVAFVVTSANRDLNPRRLERFVAGGRRRRLRRRARAQQDRSRRRSRARARPSCAPSPPGMPVVATSAQRGDGVDALTAQLGRGRTGRADRLVGRGQVDADQRAAGQRAPGHRADPRARRPRAPHDHEPELFALPHGGGLLIDTPGLRLPRMGAGSRRRGRRLRRRRGDRRRLRFSDCRHETEPGCAVREAIAAGDLDPGALSHQRKLEGEQRWAATRRR